MARARANHPEAPQAEAKLHLVQAERADQATVAVLERLNSVIGQNLEGARAGADEKYLHDLRVAVRRTRSVARQLRRVFPREPVRRFRAEFRWLQQETGVARDMDVWLLELDQHRALLPARAGRDIEPLRALLSDRRLEAYRGVARDLGSNRARALLSEWPAFLSSVPAAQESDRPDAARPIAAVAGRRIDVVYRRMVRMGAEVDASSRPEALHDLRKQGKELRYLLELFGDPFPEAVTAPMVRRLKRLQDVLGRFHDRDVQVALLQTLRTQVEGLEGGAAARRAMSALERLLVAEQARARAAFEARFSALAQNRQRKLMRATFAAQP